jgi:GNAT superfamily N-acetyltransferase
MADALPIAIRDLRPGEVNFARKAWLRSSCARSDDADDRRKGDSALARALGRATYCEGHHAIVSRLLSTTTVRLAVSADNDNVFVGFACVEPPHVVHYVYVIEECRRFGVARRLLEGVTERATYTHRTDICRQLPIPEGWRFNFYRAVTR